MGKKLIVLTLAAVMSFGIFGLTACDNVSLDEYKAAKSTELQAYADAKSADGSYCESGLAAICDAVTAGKTAIENATTKPAVTTAFNDAKGVIDEVEENIVKDFELTITVNKTTAKIGDTISATIIFKNLSGKDIEAELPSWIAAGGGTEQRDILTAVFTFEDDFEWLFEDILFEQKSNIVIEKEAVVERVFEYTVVSTGDLEIYAGAFFIAVDYTSNSYGIQITAKSTKITIQ